MIFDSTLKEIKERRETLDKWEAFLREKGPKVEETIERIRAALKKLHLSLPPEKCSWRITGEKFSGDPLSKEIHLSIAAVPSEKFKFLTFRGYDSQGRGRNQQALEAKAEKIANAIGESLDSSSSKVSVSVNCFSLELKREGKEKRVLIDVWIHN